MPPTLAALAPTHEAQVRDVLDLSAIGVHCREPADLEREAARLLRPGAPLVVLEFSHPQAFPVKQAYEAYSKHILPRIGKAVSGSSEAYEYLPESVAQFPDGQAFVDEMRAVGFTQCTAKPLTFGIVTLYRGRA